MRSVVHREPKWIDAEPGRLAPQLPRQFSRQRLLETRRRILVVIDFSTASRAALEYASVQGQQHLYAIDVVHFCFPLDMHEDAPSLLAWFASTPAGDLMADQMAILEHCCPGEVRGRLEVGEPSRVILKLLAAEHYRLIIMGASGATARATRALEQTVATVRLRTSCPVLAIASRQEEWN